MFGVSLNALLARCNLHLVARESSTWSREEVVLGRAWK